MKSLKIIIIIIFILKKIKNIDKQINSFMYIYSF